jgi:4-hydroxybenzoate polyprenyltransferase
MFVIVVVNNLLEDTMSDAKSPSANLVELFQTGRPLTGLYAFLLSVVSFKFFDWNDWRVGIGVGVVFCFLTMSIMRFNDLIDAENDCRKGKFFATDHRGRLLLYWLLEALMLVVGMLILFQWSHSLATFCAFVWIAGLGYSFIPHWYIAQNVIVALCSGSPALCAAMHFGHFESHSLATFCLFTSLIWLSEVHKDIEDQRTDVGYKVTLPTELGGERSVLLLVASLHIVAAMFFWHPVIWLQLVAVTLIPKMAYEQGLSLLNQAQIERPMATMNRVIAAIGFVLYIA